MSILEGYIKVEDKVMEPYEYDPSNCYKSCEVHTHLKEANNPICYYNHKKVHSMSNKIVGLRQFDYCAVFIFFEKSAGFIFDNKIINPLEGDVLVVKNKTLFYTFYPEFSNIDSYEITFPMDFFNCFKNDSIFHKLFFENIEKGFKFITLNKKNQDEVRHKFDKIDALIDSKIGDINAGTFSYIMQIIECFYLREIDGRLTDFTKRIPNKLNMAVKYINEHFTEKISVGEISKICGVSSTYLARIFKKFYFCTPNEYITHLRVTHALDLIKQGESLTHACYSSGFNDYSHFIKKFKSIFGTTPSNYK